MAIGNEVVEHVYKRVCSLIPVLWGNEFQNRSYIFIVFNHMVIWPSFQF